MQKKVLLHSEKINNDKKYFQRKANMESELKTLINKKQ